MPEAGRDTSSGTFGKNMRPIITLSVPVLILVSTLVSILSSSADFSPPIVPSDWGSSKTIKETCPRDESTNPKRYMIAWNDGPGIDGSYLVVIHPTQIFLRSSHENPNPNYVYWVAPLTDHQYALLVQFLDGYKGDLLQDHKKLGFWIWPGYTVYSLANPRSSPWYTDYWEKRQNEYLQKEEDAVKHNLQRILAELNRGLTKPDLKLPTNIKLPRYPNIPQIEDAP